MIRACQLKTNLHLLLNCLHLLLLLLQKCHCLLHLFASRQLCFLNFLYPSGCLFKIFSETLNFCRVIPAVYPNLSMRRKSLVKSCITNQKTVSSCSPQHFVWSSPESNTAFLLTCSNICKIDIYKQSTWTTEAASRVSPAAVLALNLFNSRSRRAVSWRIYSTFSGASITRCKSASYV